MCAHRERGPPAPVDPGNSTTDAPAALALLPATRSTTDLHPIRDLGQGLNAAFYVVSAASGRARRAERPARDPVRGWLPGTHED